MRVTLGNSPLATASDWPLVAAGVLFAESAELAGEEDLPVLTPSKEFGVVTRDEYSQLSGHRPNVNVATTHLMRRVRPGHFVITMGSFESGLEYSNIEGKITPHYRVLSASSACDHGYFRWLFKSEPFIDALAGQATEIRKGQEINFTKFSRLRLPVPSIPTQRRIADYLDREVGEIDAMDAELDRLVEALRERRQISIDANFSATVGLPQAKIGLVSEAITGLTYAPTDVADDGVVVHRSGSIQNSQFDRSNLLRVRCDIPESLRLRKGDLVVCSRNGSAHLVGKNAMATEAEVGETWGAFMTVIRSPQSAYLMWFLRSTEFKKHAGQFSTSTINQLTIGTLRGIAVPWPPRDVRVRIVAELDEKTAEIDAMIADAERLKELLAERRTTLITEVVTGRKEVPA